MEEPAPKSSGAKPRRARLALAAVGLVGLGVLIGIGIAFAPLWALSTRSAEALPQEHVDRLHELAERSLESDDLPVAAILVYRGEIIGEGSNAMRGDGHFAHHAEIQAIADARRRVGIQELRELDSDELTLISTWEPCAMCRGAMVNDGIENVVFLRPKRFEQRRDTLTALWSLVFGMQPAEPADLTRDLHERLHEAREP